jgi:hypothetical protein
MVRCSSGGGVVVRATGAAGAAKGVLLCPVDRAVTVHDVIRLVARWHVDLMRVVAAACRPRR